MRQLSERAQLWWLARRVWPLVVAAALSRTAIGAEQRVRIEGGADASGQTYRWTVTNLHASPLVLVRFPHYHANLFRSPPEWATESTFLVNVGVKDEPGECTARASSSAAGLQPGRSGVFEMQIAAAGAKRSKGTVQIGFADGYETTVAGVEVPGPEPAGDKYVPLIGLALIFLVAAGFRALRRGRRSLNGFGPS